VSERRTLRPEELEFATVWTPDGYMPYAYCERIAICMLDGGLSLSDALRLAGRELAREATPWVPGSRTRAVVDE
jgi:hypothetical protein